MKWVTTVILISLVVIILKSMTAVWPIKQDIKFTMACLMWDREWIQYFMTSIFLMASSYLLTTFVTRSILLSLHSVKCRSVFVSIFTFFLFFHLCPGTRSITRRFYALHWFYCITMSPGYRDFANIGKKRASGYGCIVLLYLWGCTSSTVISDKLTAHRIHPIHFIQYARLQTAALRFFLHKTRINCWRRVEKQREKEVIWNIGLRHMATWAGYSTWAF